MHGHLNIKVRTVLVHKSVILLRY